MSNSPFDDLTEERNEQKMRAIRNDWKEHEIIFLIDNFFKENGYKTKTETSRPIEDLNVRLDVYAEKDDEKVAIEIKATAENIEKTIFQVMRYSPIVNKIYIAYPETIENKSKVKAYYNNLVKFNIGILFVNIQNKKVEEFIISQLLSDNEQMGVQEKRFIELFGKEQYQELKKKNVDEKTIELMVAKIIERTKGEEIKREFKSAIFGDVLLGGLLAGGIVSLVNLLEKNYSIDSTVISFVFIVFPLLAWFIRYHFTKIKKLFRRKEAFGSNV